MGSGLISFSAGARNTKERFLSHSNHRVNRLLLLLAAIVSLLLLDPALTSFNLVTARVLLSLFFAGILVSGIYAVSESRGTLTVALLLGVPSLLSSLVIEFSDSVAVMTARQGLLALFFAFIAWVILSYVFTPGKVKADKIYGALCVYLLAGLIWASFYSILHLLQPEAFPGRAHQHPRYVYFSFVTLTTLGYGDFTPQTALAQSLATLEAVTGQIYLAVLVARLVGLHILHSKDGD